MKAALIDASSAILLYKARMFDAVARAYRLQMVPAVFGEVTVSGRHGADTFMQASLQRRIDHLQQPPMPGADRQDGAMGDGERDTITAFAQGASDFIIMDDGKGARVCRARGIPYVNALLCPKILYYAGDIDMSHFRTAFKHLQRIGRYSAKVITFARICTPDMLTDFYPHPLPSI